MERHHSFVMVLVQSEEMEQSAQHQLHLRSLRMRPVLDSNIESVEWYIGSSHFGVAHFGFGLGAFPQ